MSEKKDLYKKYLKYKYKYSKMQNESDQNIKKIFYKQKYFGYKNQLGFGKSIWIEENFFSKNNFEEILNYTSKLEVKDDPRSSNRFSLCLENKAHQKFYDMIYKNDKFISLIQNIKSKYHTTKTYPSYPIEYRKYFTGSKGMDWHQDMSLLSPDAYEVVLTLNNNSDSEFKWIFNNKEYSLSPKPNTLAIVKPETILHNVTPVNYGERTILKFIIEFMNKDKGYNIKKPEFMYEINKCPF